MNEAEMMVQQGLEMKQDIADMQMQIRKIKNKRRMTSADEQKIEELQYEIDLLTSDLKSMGF